MNPTFPDDQGGLVATNISISIRGKQIVRNVSLKVHPGEIVGILGPNGAGKTTCFHLIAGIRLAETGEVRIDGHDVSHLPLYRRSRLGLGFLPQEKSIFRTMSVEDNIMAVLEVHLKDRHSRNLVMEDILKEFSIWDIRKSRADTLSGGQCRRVEIARCIACNPRFIMLDEPFAGLDPIIIGTMQGVVRYMKERGIGVLITDHNARETLDMVDRVYIMFDGEIITDGAPEDVKKDKFVRQAYLGNTYM